MRGGRLAGALGLGALALSMTGCGLRDDPPPPTATPTPAAVLEIVTPTPGTPPRTGTRSGSTRYVVQPGDSLIDIADRFGVSLAELQKANGIDDPDSIYAGQVLTIPEPK